MRKRKDWNKMERKEMERKENEWNGMDRNQKE